MDGGSGARRIFPDWKEILVQSVPQCVFDGISVPGMWPDACVFFDIEG